MAPPHGFEPRLFIIEDLKKKKTGGRHKLVFLKIAAGAANRPAVFSVVLDVMRTVAIPVEKIVDWPSFHDVFKCELGFPDFYGSNMDAWIDCMTSVDTPAERLTTITVQPGEILILRIDEPFEFRRR